MSRYKKIKHPVFFGYICNNQENDKLWSTVFEQMAYGIFPYGVNMNNNVISCMLENGFTYNISNKKSSDIFNDLKVLIRPFIGVTHNDNIDTTKVDKTDNESEHVIKWNNIKKNHIKDMFMKMFVANMTDKYNLSPEMTDKLLRFIKIAIIFKIIDTDEIVCNKSGLQSVNGITITDNNVSISHDLNFNSDKNKISESTFVSPTFSLDTLWLKFIKDMDRLAV